MFGSSTIVVAIEAIKESNGLYLAYTDNGREYTGVDVFEWAQKVAELGAGEIVITSVDKEGTGQGYDLDLVSKITNLVGIPVILIGSYILSIIPHPSKEEILARNDITPMSSEERVKMFKGLKVSIIPLTLLYVILTIYRDLRDSFMVDIFHELLIDVQPSVFTSIELAITFCVGLILLVIAKIQSHRKALITHHILFLISALIIGITTFLLMNKQISAITCMFLTGFATYLAYVPFNSMLFERLISLYKYQGTVGFLIYFADSFGYLGSCILYIVSSLLMAKSIWLQTFLQTGMIYACISPILIAISLYLIIYIKPKYS